jgi:two-component system OmpR family response regulator
MGGMTASPRILIVEDDASVRLGIESALRSEGYQVHAAASTEGLDRLISQFRPDLAVLDVELGEAMDGFAFAQVLRARSDSAIVFVTAADALEDRLRGFDVGADDYLVKPFAMAELMARIRTLLRRTGRLISPSLEFRDLVVDQSSRTVVRGGNVIVVTDTEFELLRTLVQEPGRVFSKMQLLSLVWGFDAYDPNLVEVYVSALRRKLEDYGPRLIHTERGRGYVLRA